MPRYFYCWLCWLLQQSFPDNPGQVRPGSRSRGEIGVNWGQGHRSPEPPPALVVAKLVELSAQRVRLYSTLDAPTQQALANTGIRVTITMWPDAGLSSRRPLLGGAAYEGQLVAQAWVRDHVLMPAAAGAAVDFVLVGNEPDWTTAYDDAVLPALANLHDALIAMGLRGRVRTGVPLAGGVLADAWPPSSAAFQPRISDQIRILCKLLRIVGSPFVVHLYPYFGAASAQSSGTLGAMGYYFFQPGNNSTFVDPGNSLLYSNSLDANLDSVHTALQKIGYDDLTVALFETGWPTSGDHSLASTANAEAYNKGLVSHLKTGVGTPLKPGRSPDTLLFELLDSNEKRGIEAHWGLFSFDAQARALRPKYQAPVFP